MYRVFALREHLRGEAAETLIIWGNKCSIIQRWYRGFLTIRRIKKMSIQIREQSEQRRLRLRKLRVQVQFYKTMIRKLGIVPEDYTTMRKRAEVHYKRSIKVVKSAGKYMKVVKKNMQKIIILFGQARVAIRITETTAEVELEGKASSRTDIQIEKDIKRNALFLEHEAMLKRNKAHGKYKNKDTFQKKSKLDKTYLEDELKRWTNLEKEYIALDEEGQVRNQLKWLTAQWDNDAVARIVGLFRGRHARIVVRDQIQRKKERTLLEVWGSLKVQTTWRCYKSKKIANHKRKRRDFHIAHPRVIALAKKTHRPLGFYEQELKTVAMMANIGLTEERLTKIEEKMKFILKPWYKRRLTNEKFKTYSTFIQQYIPKRNRPLPSQEVQNRDVLQEFFKYMHMTVANFNTIHCPWKETTTATFIKMKVVIKIVNAKAKFREDGGIKHWNLFQLQDTIAERGGCIIPAGKPTYFPKMPVLSPQTFGIWKIPMEHADPELGNLPRATDVQLMMNGGFGSDDEESVDGGPTREELYLQALMEDGIADRDEHGKWEKNWY